MKPKSRMKLITVHMPVPYLEKIEELKAKGFFPSTAECLRTGTRTILYEHIEAGHIESPMHKKTPAETNQYNVSIGSLFK